MQTKIPPAQSIRTRTHSESIYSVSAKATQSSKSSKCVILIIELNLIAIAVRDNHVDFVAATYLKNFGIVQG